MYLIYNREYELIGEANEFSQVKSIIGEDVREQDVNSLTFIRGKTVITEDNLKRLIHEIVATEKAEVVDYITEEVESQEDETVELKTSNRHLQNKLTESREYLSGISARIGQAVNGSKELTDLNGNAFTGVGGEPTEETNVPSGDLSSGGIPSKEFTEEDTHGLDDETINILQHIERKHDTTSSTKTNKTSQKSVSKVIPNRRAQTPKDINFISIIEGGKVDPIKDLKGKSLIKTTKLANDIGLDREHVEFIIEHVLTECGGTPKYQNKNVVSPTEALWVIVSALTKREGYGNNQRFQKTKENAEDFYQSWEQQKEEITSILNK